MPRALMAVALTTIAVLLSACDGSEEFEGLPPQTFPPALPEGFFGMNGQGLRPLAEEGDLETLDRHLEVIAAGGIDFVRANTDWPRHEPEPPHNGRHRYEFAGLDDWVTALAEHDLRWQAAVMGVPTPPWAAHPGAVKVCGSRAAPARSRDLAALASAIAERYGRQGSLWREHPELPYLPLTEYELWNEPNLGSFWCPLPDPEAYAAVAEVAADAILAVDPQATLLLGGLAAFERTVIEGPGEAIMSSAEFLRRMLAAAPGLARKLDVIGAHAYGARPAGVLDRLAYQRGAIRRAGLGERPIAFNESGWYTSGVGPLPALDEDVRAAYLGEVTSAVARSDCGIDSFAPHTWITREQEPANVEDWYGIADPETAEPYPSGAAYIDQVLLYEGRGPEPPPTDPVVICGL